MDAEGEGLAMVFGLVITGKRMKSWRWIKEWRQREHGLYLLNKDIEVNYCFHFFLWETVTHFDLADLFLCICVLWSSRPTKRIKDASKTYSRIPSCHFTFWSAIAHTQQAACSFILATYHTLSYIGPRQSNMLNIPTFFWADQSTLHTHHTAGISVRKILRAILIIEAFPKGRIGLKIGPNVPCVPCLR